jgi:hypothetical protein
MSDSKLVLSILDKIPLIVTTAIILIALVTAR